MPYKQRAEAEQTGTMVSGALAGTDHNPLWNSAVEHPVNAGLTQRLECDPYKVEVAGSNPAARTIPLTKGYTTLVDAEDFERFGHLKWYLDGAGYARRTVRHDDKKRYLLMHRAILGLAWGDDLCVDHINRDQLDNRRVNLRLASKAQNAQNHNRQTSIAKAGFLGVRPHVLRRSGAPIPKTCGFRGYAKSQGRVYYTRVFSCPILAAAARDVLAQSLHGAFVRLNFTWTPVR